MCRQQRCNAHSESDDDDDAVLKPHENRKKMLHLVLSLNVLGGGSILNKAFHSTLLLDSRLALETR